MVAAFAPDTPEMDEAAECMEKFPKNLGGLAGRAAGGENGQAVGSLLNLGLPASTISNAVDAAEIAGFTTEAMHEVWEAAGAIENNASGEWH